MILNKILESFQNILKENLVGIYVHGSIAFGCFNRDKSDIDILTVVNYELSVETKKRLMEVIIVLNKEAPPKGIEISFVLKKFCIHFQYPTPFELHFSNVHLAWYKEKQDDYCRQMQGEDKDLAAHFTVIKQVGIVLYGEAVSNVFGVVPKENYIDSIYEDISKAEEDILNNPVYIILNLCRVAAFIQNNIVLSKEQGGRWGILKCDKIWYSLINQALNCYLSEEQMIVNEKEAVDFCCYMRITFYRPFL